MVNTADKSALSPRKKKMLHTWKLMVKHRWTYFLLIPTFVILLLFHYFPMYGIQLAFKEFVIRKGISGSPWVGMKHFEVLMKSAVFKRSVVNTLFISFYKLIFGFPATIIFALILNELKPMRYKKLAQTISYLPHFVSWVIMGGIITEMLSPSRGVVNYITSLVGIESRHFLIEPESFRTIVVITGMWKEIGWGSIIYLAAIAGINTELYEAAEIDGASRVRIIRHIIIPELMSVISIQFILQLGGILNAGFDQIFNLYNSLTYSTGDIIDTYVYRVGLQDKLQYSLSTAIGLFKNVVGLILVITTNAVVRRLGEGDKGLW